MNAGSISEKKTQEEASAYLEISPVALTHNLKFLKRDLNPKTKVMAMVKAVAYGHGAVLLAKHLQKNKSVDYLGVASMSNGIDLRNNGITLPILVFNPLLSNFEQMIRHCLEPVLHNFELLSAFSSFEKTLNNERPHPVHLKFNTGMNRFGMDLHELDRIEILLKKQALNIRSVMSHLSCSDNPSEDDFTQSQLERFDQIIAFFQGKLTGDTLYHVLNSNGVIRFPEKQFDMVRIGIGMYGATEFEDARQHLKPIAKLFAKMTEIRAVSKGDSIGYSRSGRATRDSYIGTLGIGYADGLPRSLGNGNWKVQIGKQLYPTIGNVCMDYCMIDLGAERPLFPLESAVLIFGDQKSVYDFAKAQGTISYEAMTNISKRVSRVFIQE